MKIRLQWYDMKTELDEGTEFSNVFGENMEIMAIGLRIPTKNNVNNGFFDVEAEWIPVLQPHFLHKITPLFMTIRFLSTIGIIGERHCPDNRIGHTKRSHLR